ncbi:hypothetical protein BD626DRAFT_498025 [Schizophyllum amplum]|uniref:Uncharacterized protein n=1 Tax=Schizophyllum amplum TaxID=97359 RepID=A0A550CCV1_9AGAR|nr:hypothetical protein BD626DRAFT_498025 [Auriculariopsis ampla]
MPRPNSARGDTRAACLRVGASLTGQTLESGRVHDSHRSRLSTVAPLRIWFAVHISTADYGLVAW